MASRSPAHPGAVLPVTAAQVCTPGYARSVRHPYDSEWRRLVYRIRREYGVEGRGYRIDHLVPLELSRSPDDPRNLWPEPVDQSYVKDQREDETHREVCAGTLSLQEAQREFETDWTQVR